MIYPECKTVGCTQHSHETSDFCFACLYRIRIGNQHAANTEEPMSAKYPKYYKPVGDLKEIDVYAVHQLFDINDPSGCIQHASKKLLLSGARTGGKSVMKDITEARDTLTRWIQLNQS